MPVPPRAAYSSAHCLCHACPNHTAPDASQGIRTSCPLPVGVDAFPAWEASSKRNHHGIFQHWEWTEVQVLVGCQQYAVPLHSGTWETSQSTQPAVHSSVTALSCPPQLLHTALCNRGVQGKVILFLLLHQLHQTSGCKTHLLCDFRNQQPSGESGAGHSFGCAYAFKERHEGRMIKKSVNYQDLKLRWTPAPENWCVRLNLVSSPCAPAKPISKTGLLSWTKAAAPFL